MSDQKAAWRSFDYGKWREENNKFDHETWNKLLDESINAAQDAGEKWIDVLCSSRKKAKEACGGSPPFRPGTWYNATGDILEVYLSDEPSYAKWLNPQVTVLLCQETDEVVGFQIWGLSHVEEIKELARKWDATTKITSTKIDSSTKDNSSES